MTPRETTVKEPVRKDVLPVVTVPRLPAVTVALVTVPPVTGTDATTQKLLSGADLRRMRAAVGMSQTDLAEALGYSRAMVCRWESDVYRVPRAHYPRLIAVLTLAQQRLDDYRALLRQLDRWPTIGTLESP